MINIFDGFNVRLRAMTTQHLAGEKRLNVRQEYEKSCVGINIWCWDGVRHNDRRKALYSEYKAKREPMAEDHASQIRLFRELLNYSSATQVDCAGWEADDVAATLARKFAAKGFQVVCHTSDMDYLQLEANPLIRINGVTEKSRSVPPRWVPLYKALRGDNSDNISGIPGFGPKTWEQCRPWWPDLEAAIKAGVIPDVPLPARITAWLHEPGNLQLLQNMLLITHMYQVPDDELEKGLIVGKFDPQAADALLNRYFL